MSERDLDIDFDFFDEGETVESSNPRRFARRGPKGPPPGPPGPHTSLTPLLRLIGVIAFGIFIVVVLVFWVQSCQSASKHTRYSNYMQNVTSLASQSARLGANLNLQLTTPGIKLADLEDKINGLARQQQLLVEQSEGLTPPGPLRTIHQHLVESLQFRESGLAGLVQAFQREGAASKVVPGAGKRIASQTLRFTTSDVVYDDLFKTPAQRVLSDEGVAGVRVPDSNFVQNAALTSPATLVALLKRTRDASTGQTPSGKHGSEVVGTTVEPGGLSLSTSKQTTVNVSDKLAFLVTVKDSGDFPETQIPVHFTIKQAKPIRETQTIDLIEPGKTKTLRFADNFGARVSFDVVTIVVTVDPVPGETFTGNNTQKYQVIFTLP